MKRFGALGSSEKTHKFGLYAECCEEFANKMYAEENKKYEDFVRRFNAVVVSNKPASAESTFSEPAPAREYTSGLCAWDLSEPPVKPEEPPKEQPMPLSEEDSELLSVIKEAGSSIWGDVTFSTATIRFDFNNLSSLDSVSAPLDAAIAEEDDCGEDAPDIMDTDAWVTTVTESAAAPVEESADAPADESAAAPVEEPAAPAEESAAPAEEPTVLHTCMTFFEWAMLHPLPIFATHARPEPEPELELTRSERWLNRWETYVRDSYTHLENMAGYIVENDLDAEIRTAMNLIRSQDFGTFTPRIPLAERHRPQSPLVRQQAQVARQIGAEDLRQLAFEMPEDEYRAMLADEFPLVRQQALGLPVPEPDEFPLVRQFALGVQEDEFPEMPVTHAVRQQAVGFPEDDFPELDFRGDEFSDDDNMSDDMFPEDE